MNGEGQAFRTKMFNIKGFESFTLKTFDITAKSNRRFVMKFKHLVLLVAAFMMTFNMMSLNVNAATQEEENLAKGSIFAWCAVMLATGKTTQEGLSQFTTIAKAKEQRV
jgi:hypothetical protein